MIFSPSNVCLYMEQAFKHHSKHAVVKYYVKSHNGLLIMYLVGKRQVWYDMSQDVLW